MSRGNSALIFGLSSLGFLVGNLIGLTADSVVKTLIPLLFAFAGGSSIAFLERLSLEERTRAAAGIGCLSLFCLVGTYVGIAVVENQIMTPAHLRVTDAEGTTSIEARKLLRSEILEHLSSVDQRLRNKQIDYPTAYRELREAIDDASR